MLGNDGDIREARNFLAREAKPPKFKYPQYVDNEGTCKVLHLTKWTRNHVSLFRSWRLLSVHLPGKEHIHVKAHQTR